MKLKAVTSEAVSEEFLGALDGIRPLVLREVLMPFLHVPEEFGPAEFYVQKTDLADGSTHEPFIEARLTGVSRNRRRSTEDFHRAADALFLVYRSIALLHLLPGERAQVFVCVMVDQTPLDDPSPIIERGPEWVTKLESGIPMSDEKKSDAMEMLQKIAPWVIGPVEKETGGESAEAE